MNFHENEEAVSPVIGVILMVAITVILAAVIAVFVFGMAGDVQSTKSIGVTAKQNGDDVIVTYMGGPDHASLTGLAVTITCGNTSGTGCTADTNLGTTVGASYTYPGAGTPDQDRVLVTGTFGDGSSQVIFDSYV